MRRIKVNSLKNLSEHYENLTISDGATTYFLTIATVEKILKQSNVELEIIPKRTRIWLELQS